MKVDRQLILLAVSSALVLVLGTVAFLQDGTDLLTAAYKAVQLFSTNSGVPEGDARASPLLEISRWLAVGAVSALVYAAARALLVHFRTTLRIASSKGHAIVCGAGRRGDALARTLIKNGSVVVIEIDENSPSLGELRNLGVFVVIGNALDAAVLQSAGVTRAKSLFAVTGSDEKNLSICTEVEDTLNRNCELSAGLESWAWRAFILDRMRSRSDGKSKIRLDSYLCRATRGLMMEIACKAAREPDLRRRGVRILIEASAVRRQELIRAALVTLQISGDKRPVLELTSVEPGEQVNFLDRFPEAGLVAEFRWHKQPASQAFPEGNSKPPDFAVFDLDLDIETLEAAERFWMRHRTPDDHVIACLDEDDQTGFLGSIKTRERDFRVANLMSFGVDSLTQFDDAVERDAKICHAVYFASEKKKDPTYGSKSRDHPEHWADLSERYKDSNRLAAAQIKLARLVWDTRGDTPGLEILTHLARSEHMRWMAEKAMDGWRWSGPKSRRDDDKLKHPLLVPFSSLSNPSKDKDFDTFLWALDLTRTYMEELGLNSATVESALFGQEVALRSRSSTESCS
jgi:hypothetical protein